MSGADEPVKDIEPVTSLSLTESTASPTLDGERTLDSSPLASSGSSAGSGGNRATTEPKSMGPYRLVQKLGEGGMGQLWLAEQTETARRQVALKLIKIGLYDDAVLKRFQSGRQSLASMDRDSICSKAPRDSSQMKRFLLQPPVYYDPCIKSP
jgi:serine/threonine protein kinase